MIVWPSLAAFFVLTLNLAGLYAGTLFYILPAVYLSIKIPGQIKKTLTIAFVWSLLFISLDYIWQSNSAWVINSAFQLKLFGRITFEDFGWSFICPYFVVIFYEYFFEKDRVSEKTTKTTETLLKISLVLFSGMILFGLLIARPILVPYSYLTVGGALVLIPPIVVLYEFPNLIKKFFGITVYFAYLSFLLELVALNEHYWFFPITSQYIGEISPFGVTFPVEEFLYFIIFSALSILSFYEFFDDDRM